MATAPPTPTPQAGNVAGASMEDVATAISASIGPPTRLGPFEKVHVFWLAGMSCDGCSIAVLGATAPSVESLLTGTLPGVPQLVLHHTAVQVEAGEAFVEPMRRAWKGELGAPYVIVYEGSIADESKADALGCSPTGENFTERVGPVLLFLRGLGPLPEFAPLGRPACRCGERAHRHC